MSLVYQRYHVEQDVPDDNIDMPTCTTLWVEPQALDAPVDMMMDPKISPDYMG